MWATLLNIHPLAADVGETIKCGRVKRLRSKFVWAPAEHRWRLLWPLSRMNCHSRHLLLPLGKHTTHPSAMSATDRSPEEEQVFMTGTCTYHCLTNHHWNTSKDGFMFQYKCLTFKPNNSFTLFSDGWFKNVRSSRWKQDWQLWHSSSLATVT